MNSARTRSADCLFLGILTAIAMALLCPGCGEESKGPVNRAPEITSLTAAPDKIEPLESSTLSCSANDPDGDVLVYEWTAEFGSLSGSGASVVWTAPDYFDTCLVTVIVYDGHGESDTAEVSIEVPEGTLLVQTTEGLAAVSMDGSYFLYPDLRGPVEVLGTRIFVKLTLHSYNILEIDNHGATLASRTIPSGVWNYTVPAVLPDTGFAFLDNSVDSIHFSDPQGDLTQSVAMPNGNNQENQVTDGVVVGNRLIVSENGNDQIIEVDLATYTTSVLRDLSGLAAYLSGIDYSRGFYYLCDADDKVSTFGEDGPVSTLNTLGGVLIAITVVGDYAYVTANSSGTVHKVNINSGSSEIFVEGLNHPEDIEYVTLAMEPPTAR
jgi:hypothetical protein